MQLKENEEKVVELNTETEQLIQQRDSASRNAELWRSELAEAEEHNVRLEADIFYTTNIYEEVNNK